MRKTMSVRTVVEVRDEVWNCGLENFSWYANSECRDTWNGTEVNVFVMMFSVIKWPNAVTFMLVVHRVCSSRAGCCQVRLRWIADIGLMPNAESHGCEKSCANIERRGSGLKQHAEM